MTSLHADGMRMIEGDVMMSRKQYNDVYGRGNLNSDYKWPGGVIPYTIDNTWGMSLFVIIPDTV